MQSEVRGGKDGFGGSGGLDLCLALQEELKAPRVRSEAEWAWLVSWGGVA